MFFLNLAPFNFRNVLGALGPVEKIEVVSYRDALKEMTYEALVYLKPHYKNAREKSGIYGKCDGSGTDRSEVVAIRKGVAEAIERWAFYSLNAEKKHRAGLNVDPTSTGFAALPCFPRRAARRFALIEAVERWAITNWWNGRLPARVVDFSTQFDTWAINTPFKDISVRITSQSCNDDLGQTFFVYGFSAGNNGTHATRKAIVEMDRNRRAILISGKGDISKLLPSSVSDQRILFFSGQSGRKIFLDKINDQFEVALIGEPKLMVDTEVVGHWSQYCTVWRCLLENTETDIVSPKYFLF